MDGPRVQLKPAGDAFGPPASRESTSFLIPASGGGGGTGGTVEYDDQVGARVFRVDSGHDLDQYLFADRSPLDFSINIPRNFGPVDPSGHPVAGNALWGRTGRITLRVFDVDDDYAGGTYTRELDKLVVNGVTLPNYLSGADNQWSINTFEFPLDLLRLPTADNPNGRNHFQVLIDTGNGGQLVWAVQVDWAELRFDDEDWPVALVHGITGSGGSLTDIKQFYEAANPSLVGKIINEDVTKNESIASNAALLAGDISELLVRTGSYHVNITAHSMGGLNSRLYAWDHPSQVKRLVMIATPNGGSRLANIICGNRNVPWYLRSIANEAMDYFTRAFGECNGPEDGLYQLQEDYVQDVFNRQVLDRHGTKYFTIAGQGNAAANLLLDGEDDGAVSVASVRYLRPDLPADPNPGHPGIHTALYPAYEENHSGLIESGSPAISRSFCAQFPLYCPNGVGGFRRAPERALPSPATAYEFSSNASRVIGERSSTTVPLSFEDAPGASVIVLTDRPGSVAASLGGVPLSASEIFEVPALSADLSSPADGHLTLTNNGNENAAAIVLVLVETTRRMTIDVPSLVGPADDVTATVALSGDEPGDSPLLQVLNDDGAVVAEPHLSPTGAGQWSATFDAPPAGVYSLQTWVEGAKARFASAVMTVSSGSVSFAGGFTTSTVDALNDGLIDSLVVRPNLSVTTPGDYRIAARLVDGTGATVGTAGGTGTLAAGAQTVPLSFHGPDLYASGRSGPYRVVDAVVSQNDPTMAIEDVAGDLGATPAYDYFRFEHFPVEIDLGGFSDRGLDYDGNGILDAIEVTGAVSLDHGGSYAINARLVSENGTELGEFATTMYMSPGRNPFAMTFGGAGIAAAGLDGPYFVTDLSIYALSSSNTLGYLVQAHRTADYRVDQFITGGSGGGGGGGGGGAMTFATLRDMLHSLESSGEIRSGVAKSLIVKVDAAEASNDRERMRTARYQLEAILNELEAQRGKHVSENAYEQLKEAVEDLIASL